MTRCAPPGHRWPWVATGLSLSCVVLAAAPQTAAGLELDRVALLQGEWWRLWSAHLVHFSLQHALADGMAIGLLGALAERLLGPGRLLAIVAAGSALIAISVLWADPALATYRGASGLASLLAAVSCTRLWAGAPPLRGAVTSAMTFLTGKILLESTGVLAGLSTLPPGVAVAWQAHAAGLLCGLLAGLAAPAAGNACRIIGCASSNAGIPRPRAQPRRHLHGYAPPL